MPSGISMWSKWVQTLFNTRIARHVYHIVWMVYSHWFGQCCHHEMWFQSDFLFLIFFFFFIQFCFLLFSFGIETLFLLFIMIFIIKLTQYVLAFFFLNKKTKIKKQKIAFTYILVYTHYCSMNSFGCFL